MLAVCLPTSNRKRYTPLRSARLSPSRLPRLHPCPPAGCHPNRHRRTRRPTISKRVAETSAPSLISQFSLKEPHDSIRQEASRSCIPSSAGRLLSTVGSHRASPPIRFESLQTLTPTYRP